MTQPTQPDAPKAETAFTLYLIRCKSTSRVFALDVQLLTPEYDGAEQLLDGANCPYCSCGCCGHAYGVEAVQA